MQKTMQIVAPTLAVSPKVSGTAQPPAGDACSYVPDPPSSSSATDILIVTLGAQSGVASLDPLMAQFATIGFTSVDVPGVGVPAKLTSPDTTLWVLTAGRMMSLRGQGLKQPELTGAAKVLIPAVAAATVPPPRVSLAACDTWDHVAERITGPATVRRDARSSSYLTCEVAGPANSVIIDRVSADPSKALADQESGFGRHPVAGLAGSFWSDGTGLVRLNASEVARLTVYPAADDAGGIQLLKDIAANP